MNKYYFVSLKSDNIYRSIIDDQPTKYSLEL